MSQTGDMFQWIMCYVTFVCCFSCLNSAIACCFSCLNSAIAWSEFAHMDLHSIVGIDLLLSLVPLTYKSIDLIDFTISLLIIQ